VSEDQQRRIVAQQQRWHGWGSPVGLGFALVAAGLSSLIVSIAVLAH
jgi:hypothetical protein